MDLARICVLYIYIYIKRSKIAVCGFLGGMVGMVMTGIFASKGINSAVVDEGLAFGQTKLFITHIIALVGVSVFAFVMSYALLKITDLILPLRVTEEDEKSGLDVSQHDEFLIEA